MDIPEALFSSGSTASMKRMMPRPPIHWVRALQKSSAWVCDSTSGITLAPVVVSPDITSKKASVKPRAFSPVMNGMMPNIVNTIQISAVIMNPSRLWMADVWLFVPKVAIPPVRAALPAAAANPVQSPSP